MIAQTQTKVDSVLLGTALMLFPFKCQCKQPRNTISLLFIDRFCSNFALWLNAKHNFDQKTSLMQPSNLSMALILEAKGLKPPYSNILALLRSLQFFLFSACTLISTKASVQVGCIGSILGDPRTQVDRFRWYVAGPLIHLEGSAVLYFLYDPK